MASFIQACKNLKGIQYLETHKLIPCPSCKKDTLYVVRSPVGGMCQIVCTNCDHDSGRRWARGFENYLKTRQRSSTQTET